MKVSEEIEALEVMAINPVQFLVVPRFLAMIVMLPALTIFGNYIGILGGWAVCIFPLDLNTAGYILRAVESAETWDLYSGMIKSVVFAWIIITIACNAGLNVEGGAEGVGQATTAVGSASFAGNVSHERGTNRDFLFRRMKANGKPIIEVDRSRSKIRRSRRARRACRSMSIVARRW